MDFLFDEFFTSLTSFLHIEGECSIRSMVGRSAVPRRTVSGDELTVAVDRGGLVEPSPVALAIGQMSRSALQALKDNDEAMGLFRATESHRVFLFADLLNDCGDYEEHDCKKVFVTKHVNTLLKAKVKTDTDREKKNLPSAIATNRLHPNWFENVITMVGHFAHLYSIGQIEVGGDEKVFYRVSLLLLFVKNVSVANTTFPSVKMSTHVSFVPRKYHFVGKRRSTNLALPHFGAEKAFLTVAMPVGCTKNGKKKRLDISQ